MALNCERLSFKFLGTPLLSNAQGLSYPSYAPAKASSDCLGSSPRHLANNGFVFRRNVVVVCPISPARELNCISPSPTVMLLPLPSTPASRCQHIHEIFAYKTKDAERSAVISLKYCRLLKFLYLFLDSMMGCQQIMYKFE